FGIARLIAGPADGEPYREHERTDEETRLEDELRELRHARGLAARAAPPVAKPPSPDDRELVPIDGQKLVPVEPAPVPDGPAWSWRLGHAEAPLDDGHGWSWKLRHEGRRPGWFSGRVAAAIALLAAAIAAALGFLVFGGGTSKKTTAPPPPKRATRPVQPVRPRRSVAPVPAAARAPARPLQITWGDSVKTLAYDNGNCGHTDLYTLKLGQGFRFVNGKWQIYPASHFAGERAVVEFYGPQFPGNPRYTRTVGADGTFTVQVHPVGCFQNAQEGAAILRVGSVTNLSPSAASTIGSSR